MNPTLIALLAGALIGLSLGALGGGGSILAVPVLIYGLGQGSLEATTGSLVVVGVTSVAGAATAWRRGTVRLGRGLAFGAVAIVGAAVGARASVSVPESVLLAAFAILLLVVGMLMAYRQLRSPHIRTRQRPEIDDPIISFTPEFVCRCPAAAKVLVTATSVGLVTGFSGVGGGFLVVPALLLALGLPIRTATGTALVVISMTSAAALLVRTGLGVHLDWVAVSTLTIASVAFAHLGVKLATRVPSGPLTLAFTLLLLGVAGLTAWQAFPAVL